MVLVHQLDHAAAGDLGGSMPAAPWPLPTCWETPATRDTMASMLNTTTALADILRPDLCSAIFEGDTRPTQK